MSKEKQLLSTLLDVPILSRVIVGIGEVTEITGVSARQIRYWESKGIIHPIAGCCTNRKYDYSNIEKIVLIKDFLDQGYTLEAAARRLEERISRLNQAIVKLTDKYDTDLSQTVPGETNDNPDMNDIGRTYRIRGEDYILVGFASHGRHNEQLRIFSPLDRNQEKLLAEPMD